MNQVISYGNIGKKDLLEILALSKEPLFGLKESKILIVGGTGFIGTWLTSALLEANDLFNLDMQLFVTTRNAINAQRKLCVSESKFIKFIEIDFQNGLIPNDISDFTHFYFGSTPTLISTGSSESSKVRNSSLRAINQMINLTKKSKKTPNFLNASSGAVYGNQSLEIDYAPEKIIDDLDAVNVTEYGKLKIDIEQIIQEETVNGNICGANPRLYTFYGPHLALNEHFAAGNFINQSISGLPVTLHGNVNTRRSYLYPVDLVSALIHVLSRPTIEPIHIGSSKGMTMLQLGQQIAKLGSAQEVITKGNSKVASNYVPANLNFRKLYSWSETVELGDGLERWASWIRKNQLPLQQ